MASKLVGIVGATGTGKSTSIKHLNPEETYIINVAKKELPFKGSEKLYNAEKKNYKEVDDAIVSGWKVKTKGNNTAILEKRTLGGPMGHFIVLILTVWFTFGLGNLAFAGYRWFMNGKELQIKVE